MLELALGSGYRSRSTLENHIKPFRHTHLRKNAVELPRFQPRDDAAPGTFHRYAFDLELGTDGAADIDVEPH